MGKCSAWAIDETAGGASPPQAPHAKDQIIQMTKWSTLRLRHAAAPHRADEVGEALTVEAHETVDEAHDPRARGERGAGRRRPVEGRLGAATRERVAKARHPVIKGLSHRRLGARNITDLG